MEYSSAARRESSRYFPETGCLVEGAFLTFFESHGVEMCGLPLTNRLWEGGIPTQYFQRLALEEAVPGQVRLKAVGSELLRLRQEQPDSVQALPSPGASRLLDAPPFEIINQLGRLPQHATQRYPNRSLDQIRHLIIHHSGVPATVGPEVIAGYHVTDLNWPGIGYHFIIDDAGHIHQTNPITVAAYHARQFNSSGIGIALLGNFSHATPQAAQLDATAYLCAWLITGLGLTPEAIKGHRELIAVNCPGEHWLQGPAWKYSLLGRVERLMRGEPVQEPVPVSKPEAAPAVSVWERPAAPPLAERALAASPSAWDAPSAPPPVDPTPAPAWGTTASPSVWGIPTQPPVDPIAARANGNDAAARPSDGDATVTPTEPAAVTVETVEAATLEPRPWWLPVEASPALEMTSTPPLTEASEGAEPDTLPSPGLVEATAYSEPVTASSDPDATPVEAALHGTTAATTADLAAPTETPDEAALESEPDDTHIPFYPRRRTES